MAAVGAGSCQGFRVWCHSFESLSTAHSSLVRRLRAWNGSWRQMTSSNSCFPVQHSASLAASLGSKSSSGASAKEGSRSLTYLSSFAHAAPGWQAIREEVSDVGSLPLGKLRALRNPFCVYSIARSPDAFVEPQNPLPAHTGSPRSPEVEERAGSPEGPVEESEASPGGGGALQRGPPLVTKSVEEEGPPVPVHVEFDVSKLPGTENARDGLMALIFTCCKCNTRAAKKFSKVAYYNGVVIVRCPCCKSPDRLKWFGDETSDIESILAVKGEAVVRSLTEAHRLDIEGMNTAAAATQARPSS
ncbi:hypothetical protein ACSSS7_000826 [Eimeria intestinalis]